MRILLVSYMDFQGPGPMHMYHFACEIRRAGHDVMVLVYGDPETADLMREPASFPIEAVRLEGFGLARDLMARIEAFRPELVHAWTPRSIPARVVLQIRAATRCRHVVHFEDAEDYLVRHHGEERFDSFEGFLDLLDDPGNWPWKLPLISAMACRYAEAFTAISPSFVSRLESEWRKRVHVLFPGVDLERFDPRNDASALRQELSLTDSIVVLYSGSVGSMHEFDGLLEAMALLRQDLPHAVLVQVGRNLIPEQTHALLDRLDLGDHCRLLGPRPHREIHRYLALADLLVQCGSPGEFNEYRLPSKIPEYLAAGRPVVTFHAGIGRLFEDGVEVAKIYSGQPGELARVMKRVLENGELASRLAREGRRRAEELFDWQRNARGLLELYRKVLDSPRELRLEPDADRDGYDVFLQPPPAVRRKRLSRPLRRIVVISPDPVPLPGRPTSGAGLRAWSLAEGLKRAGREVVLSVPRKALEALPDPPSDLLECAFDPEDIRGSVEALAPEAALFCHWPVLSPLERRLAVPTILDLAGPHLLERRHMQGIDGIRPGLAEKLRALSMADRILCAGTRQASYFLPFLMASGFDPEEDSPGILPISLPAPPPERVPSAEATVVYAGLFLPWQDPRPGLQAVVETMDEIDRGRLVIYGGSHPLHPVGIGIWEEFLQRFARSERVEFRGLVPFQELQDALRTATVAFDLMERNTERSLAFNVRTVVHLWCGLPVLHGSFTELGSWVRRYGAGWSLDPADRDGLKDAVRTALTDPQEVERRSRAARRLWEDQLRTEALLDPLLDFLERPWIRETSRVGGRPGEGPVVRIAELEAQLHRLHDAIVLKEQHIRNLEAFRNRVRGLPPYRMARWLRQSIRRGRRA